VKAEDFVDSNQEGAEIIAIKLGSGLFLPAIFQLISGIVVLGSVYRKPPPNYLLVCIISYDDGFNENTILGFMHTSYNLFYCLMDRATCFGHLRVKFTAYTISFR
jgi:hypothetical protein